MNILEILGAIFLALIVIGAALWSTGRLAIGMEQVEDDE